MELWTDPTLHRPLKASHQSQLSGSPVPVASLTDASCLVMGRWRKVPESQFRVGNNNPKVARALHLSLRRGSFVYSMPFEHDVPAAHFCFPAYLVFETRPRGVPR